MIHKIFINDDKYDVTIMNCSKDYSVNPINLDDLDINNYKLGSYITIDELHFKLESYKKNFNIQKEFIKIIKSLRKNIKTHFINDEIFNEIPLEFFNSIYNLTRYPFDDNRKEKFFVITNINNFDYLIKFNEKYKFSSRFILNVNTDKNILNLAGYDFDIYVDDDLDIDYLLFGKYNIQDANNNGLIYIENNNRCGLFKIGDDKSISENYTILYLYNYEEYMTKERQKKINNITK